MENYERRDEIHFLIRNMLGRDLTPNAWQIIDDQMDKMGYLEYFLSLENDPLCYYSFQYPRHSPSTQMCTSCTKGQPLEKDVEVEFNKYMDNIYPLLFAERMLNLHVSTPGTGPIGKYGI